MVEPDRTVPALVRLLGALLLLETDYVVVEVKDRALMVEHRETGRKVMLGAQLLPE